MIIAKLCQFSNKKCHFTRCSRVECLLHYGIHCKCLHRSVAFNAWQGLSEDRVYERKYGTPQHTESYFYLTYYNYNCTCCLWMLDS